MKMNSKAPAKIILVGFMGTGKSTVSKLLSAQLGWKCVDIDEEIEQRAGKRISEIFAEGGEEAFRNIESEVLASILSEATSNAVIATGGGAVLRPINREVMLQYGFVVGLKADAEQIIARVSADTNRPLLEGDPSARVNMLLEQRKHAYDFAHYSVDTTHMTEEQVVHAIRNEWSKL